MKKSRIILMFLIASSMFTAHALIPLTVGLEPEDRIALSKAEKSFKEAAESLKKLAEQIESNKISKALTQTGVVFISTSTAMLSAYAVFLLIKYELSRQPDTQEPSKTIGWKTTLAGTIGTTVFAASILALMKSSAIAEYAIAG